MDEERRVFCSQLMHLHYEFTHCQTLAELKHRVKDADYHLLIFELKMCDEDFRELHFPHADMPILFLIEPGVEDQVQMLLRHRFCDFVVMPSSPEELKLRVSTLIKRKELADHLRAEQRVSEERRRGQQERSMLVGRMRSLRTLAEGMSSDLEYVLAPLMNFPAGIVKQLPEDHVLVDPLRQVCNSAKEVSVLIDELRGICRTGSVSPEAVDLNEVVRSLLDSPSMLEVRKLHPKIEFKSSLESGLPMIYADRERVHRALNSLVSNAIDAQPGGGLIAVTTSLHHAAHPVGIFEQGAAGDYVELAVGDRGSGIRSSEWSRIFDPCYTTRADEPLRHRGLGLTEVYRIARDHNAFIELDSSCGHGSRFSLFFPPLKEQPQELTGQGECVLIVDDREEHARVADTLLQNMGYRTEIVSCGHDALTKLETRKQKGDVDFHLVLLDLVLGDDFDGLDTFHHMKKICPDQKVVLMSGFAETSRIVEARKYGLVHFVQKPLTMDNLGKVIVEALEPEQENSSR